MAQGMELWRPDWFKVMEGCTFNEDGRNNDANELVSITKETAKLALLAIKTQCETDYYHNYGAAKIELIHILAS